MILSFFEGFYMEYDRGVLSPLHNTGLTRGSAKASTAPREPGILGAKKPEQLDFFLAGD